MIIRTRQNLLDWIEKHVKCPGVVRSLQDGIVEVLGGFDYTHLGPRRGWAGWIVRVKSKYDKCWFIAVFPDPVRHGYKYRELQGKPSWSKWIGDKSESRLYQGDDPVIYRLLKGQDNVAL